MTAARPRSFSGLFVLWFGASSDARALLALLFLFVSAQHERQVLEFGAAVFVQPFNVTVHSPFDHRRPINSPPELPKEPSSALPKVVAMTTDFLYA